MGQRNTKCRGHLPTLPTRGSATQSSRSTGVQVQAVEVLPAAGTTPTSHPYLFRLFSCRSFYFRQERASQNKCGADKKRRLGSPEGQCPSQQQVQLRLQLSQLLYLNLHQDCPCSNAPRPPMWIKGMGSTRPLWLQMLLPLMVFPPKRHLSISRNSPRPHQR